MKAVFKYLYIVIVLILFGSCKSGYETINFTSAEIPNPPRYDNENHWAVLPGKYPEVLESYAPKDLSVLQADVFYVYPTLIQDPKDTRWNAPIEDEVQREMVINRAVHYQASAWASSGRLFVPYYRQAHIRSYDYYNQGGKEAFRVAYSDVKAAFEYYLTHYNQGRPIIIASHSQGTTHTKRLLKEFFDGTLLQEQLVAAYLVGMDVLPQIYGNLKPMKSPSETGGYLCWNTFKKGYYPKKKDKYNGSVTSNPVTWDTTLTTDFNDHKGFLFSNGVIYDKALKIKIVDGLVWTSLPRFPLRFFMVLKKNYHIGDINLFWKDIKENSELRTQNWLNK
jgi:hypothetical protein